MPVTSAMRASAPSDVEPAATAAAAPITFRCRPRALPGGLLLAIAGVWLGALIEALRAGSREALLGPGSAGIVIAFAIGVALALIGLEWIARCRTVVLHQGRLRATERRLTGKRAFEEVLANYYGLRFRRQQLRHPSGLRTWYVVEAWHREPAKTVELARSKDPGQAQQWAEDLARRLALPLCQEPDREARVEAPRSHGGAADAVPDRPQPAAYSAPARH